MKKRYGRWSLLRLDGQSAEVICDCGVEKTISWQSLHMGRSRSCGCLRRTLSIKKFTTHGMSKTRFYRLWYKMIERTTKEYYSEYQHYGGRGIKPIERWLDFNSFKEDMFASYKRLARKIGESNVSIERIDVNGDYSPSNCKWIHQNRQALNRRTTMYVVFKGKQICFADLCRLFNINYFHARMHLDRAGIFIDKERVERVIPLVHPPKVGGRTKGLHLRS